ncbi:ABC transporter ATP-binding protein [Saliphagus infecundisoli]|uniref:ABC-type D-xylose/L-arabinose transporter n=1 Tax=Saliphagus infecundisoli TaxID=1849069 RepID=A0ABD5QJF8_9EURY|nr:sn-glycerol-3-phosphate ABC transporter ATP-binding protein UgpC [Saliphagus infecundisoli]
MAALDIDGLVKRFGTGGDEIVAVDDVDVSIDDGDFLVLVGPSGCGKSTTLRCIAGLEEVTEGDIRLDGESIVGRKPMDRDIAMVFQNYALYPHMTARENMSFGLKMTSDLSKGEIEEIVEDTARMMGIEDLLEKKPRELSGGQQQRVALGRAIVRDPAVFLMDEPLSNLDAKLRTTMRTELQNLQQKLETTTVYVTHDQTEAMTMGDRIAILNGGKLQQIGTPLECYHQPTNQFVAGFIGAPSMNFLEVTREGTRLDHAEFSYRLSEATAERIDSETTELVLGIRPEDIELVDGEEPNAFRATVDVTEPMGDSTHVSLSIGDQQCTATVDGDVIVSPGEELWLTFPEDRIHLFDAESGVAVKNREASLTGSEMAL